MNQSSLFYPREASKEMALTALASYVGVAVAGGFQGRFIEIMRLRMMGTGEMYSRLNGEVGRPICPMDVRDYLMYEHPTEPKCGRSQIEKNIILAGTLLSGIAGVMIVKSKGLQISTMVLGGIVFVGSALMEADDAYECCRGNFYLDGAKGALKDSLYPDGSR